MLAMNTFTNHATKKLDLHFSLSNRRIMYVICLSWEIKVSRITHERKDTTTATISDLVKRDYDNLKHNQIIRATDVIYICAPCDAHQNFVYLSVVIKHLTKEVDSRQLSIYHDAKLIIDSFATIKINLLVQLFTHIME